MDQPSQHGLFPALEALFPTQADSARCAVNNINRFAVDQPLIPRPAHHRAEVLALTRACSLFLLSLSSGNAQPLRVFADLISPS